MVAKINAKTASPPSPLAVARKAKANADAGLITQVALNKVMQEQRQEAGLSMAEFLKSETGKVYLEPAPVDFGNAH